MSENSGFDMKPPFKQREIRIVPEMEPYSEEEDPRAYIKPRPGDHEPFKAVEDVVKGDADPDVADPDPEAEYAENIDADLPKEEGLQVREWSEEEKAEYEKLQKLGQVTRVWRADNENKNAA